MPKDPEKDSKKIINEVHAFMRRHRRGVRHSLITFQGKSVERYGHSPKRHRGIIQNLMNATPSRLYEIWMNALKVQRVETLRKRHVEPINMTINAIRMFIQGSIEIVFPPGIDTSNRRGWQIQKRQKKHRD